MSNCPQTLSSETKTCPDDCSYYCKSTNSCLKDSTDCGGIIPSNDLPNDVSDDESKSMKWWDYLVYGVSMTMIFYNIYVSFKCNHNKGFFNNVGGFLLAVFFYPFYFIYHIAVKC